jgi:hypothetical protein
MTTSPPYLDGALCVDSERRSGLPTTAWDGNDPVLRELAVKTCRRCPALNACRQWYNSLPRGSPFRPSEARPKGVIAGRWYP